MKRMKYISPEVLVKELYSEDCFVTASQYVNVGGASASFSFESQIVETQSEDSWVFDSPMSDEL